MAYGQYAGEVKKLVNRARNGDNTSAALLKYYCPGLKISEANHINVAYSNRGSGLNFTDI